MSASIASPLRHILAMAMVAVFGMSFRRGVTVSAFSFASFSNRAFVAGSTTTGSSTLAAASGKAFGGRGFRRMTGVLGSSAAVASDIEKAMDVEHPAFEVIKKDFVEEYGSATVLYRHKKSGAELLSVSNDDDNKVFGITFRTPPEDSTGVPHILEHSVLCGSRKYKTKDPFVQLLQGSLQTFLNAFTYPDRTCYVVASQNDKDFYNLINVYADAVFHPRAINDPNVHAQEGWHLELENKEDPLIYKGVVYNEMKGVYSSPDSLLNRASQRSIFPETTYGVDSGGDPVVIPDLSFEQFADFHKKFYHPNNSRIYFSGDDDVYNRLEIMDEYLKEFDLSPESKPGSVVQWQGKTYKEAKRESYPYPVGPDQPETHMVNMNWLMNDKRFTNFEELTIGILDHLLMGTSSAVVRKTLMESGLGSSITGGGISDELLQTTFSVGMKGVKKEDVPALEKLILATLEKVAEEGFDEDDIASSMNTIEFQLREFNTGSFPKGLSFMLGAMSKWLYDESPTEGLKFEKPLAELKARIAGSGSQVFQDMIKEYLINNSHRSTVELAPSTTMESEVVKEEEGRLAEIKSKLSDEELEEIIQKTKTLKELQATDDPPEARATIPSLELKDLKREVTEYPIDVAENEKGSGVTVLRHQLGSTSGIAYVNLGVDLSRLSVDDIPLLPLFTRVMQETGAGEYDQVGLSRQMGTHTGGISVSILTTAVHPDGSDESKVLNGENLQTKLMIRGKSTSEKTDKLFSLMNTILTDAHFDSKARVIEMLKEDKSRMESSIQGSGHATANMRMKARYRVGGYIDEMMSGISQLETIKELLKQAEEDWPSLLSRLENMRNVILEKTAARDGMFLDITGDAAVLDRIQPTVEEFLGELPGESNGEKLPNFYKEKHPWVDPVKEKMKTMVPLIDEGFVVPTQVSYVGKSGLVFDEGETVTGSAQVVARFLRTGRASPRSSGPMGAPMSSTKPVANPGDAFLQPNDGVAISFWIISIAMIAATVFFFAEAATVLSHWKTTLHVGGLVTLVAGVHYMYMREYWVQVHKSPIVYRYVDWSITVPLQMIEFNLILKAAGKETSGAMFWKLLLGTIVMLACGYLGEIAVLPAWPAFAGGMAGWAFILFEIFAGEAGGAVSGCSQAVSSSFNNMRMIVTVGWSIYPLGYLFGYLLGTVDDTFLNVIYNIADFVNKIGFVLSCWTAAKSDSAKKDALLA